MCGRGADAGTWPFFKNSVREEAGGDPRLFVRQPAGNRQWRSGRLILTSCFAKSCLNRGPRTSTDRPLLVRVARSFVSHRLTYGNTQLHVPTLCVGLPNPVIRVQRVVKHARMPGTYFVASGGAQQRGVCAGDTSPLHSAFVPPPHRPLKACHLGLPASTCGQPLSPGTA